MAITSAILAITSAKQNNHLWHNSYATVSNVAITSATKWLKPLINKAKTSA